MSIGSIELKSCQDDRLFWSSDGRELSASGRVQLVIESDTGVLSVFWYGPEMNGRLVDSYAPPHSFFINSILPGEHKIVIEQYRLGKLIDSRIWKFRVIPVVESNQKRSQFGIVDLGKLDPKQTIEAVLKLNVGSMREWFSTSGFNSYRSRNLSRTRLYAQNGIEPVFCFAESRLNDQKVGDVKTWTIDAIADIKSQLPGLRFRIEMGNEINLQINGNGPFWDSDDRNVPAKIARYIDRVQKPMFETIKSIDPAIICIAPSFSWDHKMFDLLADDLLEFADELAFHPYPNGLLTGDLERVNKSVETARNRKVRLNYTESQINYGKKYRAKEVNESKWADDVQQYLQYARNAGVDEQHYFVGIEAGTTNSPAALFKKTHGVIQTTAFYEAFAKITCER